MLNGCILIKAVPTKAYPILRGVKRIKEVKKVYVAYGRFDIIVFFEVAGYRNVRTVSAKINSLEGVRSTETLVEG